MKGCGKGCKKSKLTKVKIEVHQIKRVVDTDEKTISRENSRIKVNKKILKINKDDILRMKIL